MVEEPSLAEIVGDLPPIDDEVTSTGEQLAALKAEAAAREADEAERAPKSRKKGNRSYEMASRSALNQRDVLRIPSMVDGVHPKDPTGYHQWHSKYDANTLLTEGWRPSSRKQMGQPALQEIPGLTDHQNNDYFLQGDLILMRCSLKQHKEQREIDAHMTDAQTPEMDAAAIEYVNRTGIKTVRPGAFGQADLIRRWQQLRDRGEVEDDA